MRPKVWGGVCGYNGKYKCRGVICDNDYIRTRSGVEFDLDLMCKEVSYSFEHVEALVERAVFGEHDLMFVVFGSGRKFAVEGQEKRPGLLWAVVAKALQLNEGIGKFSWIELGCDGKVSSALEEDIKIRTVKEVQTAINQRKLKFEKQNATFLSLNIGEKCVISF